MSKVSTSTESNLKTAHYKMSGSLVKNNQFSSRDKVMEVRTHAAHIKVKSYNSLIKNNSLSQSWYNNNTSSKSIQSDFKLNKRKWQPRNEAIEEITQEQNKSRYLTQKEQQKRKPAYRNSRENQLNTEIPSSDSHSRIAQQSTKRKNPAAYKQQRTEETPLFINNELIRVRIPHHSIVNPASNVTQIIRLTEDRENNHLLKVHSFKLINDNDYNQQKNSTTRSGNKLTRLNRRRMKLMRTSPIENNDQHSVPYSRYSFSNNINGPIKGEQLLRRKIKLNRVNQHILKEGQAINPSPRYNSNNIYNSNSSTLKKLSKKEQLNKITSNLGRTAEVISRNEEDASLGNKFSHQSIRQVSKIPAYKATGKQVIGVLDESRKNIEGVFSQKTSITQMITNTNEGRKHINVSSSIRKSIKNIGGNGDLGIDTVVQTKNALLKTDKTLRVTSRAIKNTPRYTKKAVSGLKKSVQAVKWTAKAIKHPIQTAKHLIMATKLALKSLLNPIFLKGVLIFGVVAVILFSCIAAFSGITSVYAALTYTSTKEDLNDTWKHITKLDAEILEEYETVEKKPKWSHIDQFHYYMMYYPLTSASQVIAYLTAKHDDFKFSEVSGEIQSIHDQLYQINYREWEEIREECEIINEGEDDEEESCYTYTIIHLDVTLNGQPFSQWLEKSGELDKHQKERYDNTLELGGTVMLAEFGNPFGDDEWFSDITTRYGYKLDEASKEVIFHNGIDISKPSGTKINSISSGTVETGTDENGNYVIVKKLGKNEILIKYSKLDNISVTSGQKVKKGDIIGTVGPYLHLVYELNGKPYNPWFYVEGGYGIDSEDGYNPSFNVPNFTPELIASDGWTWPAQSTNISSYFGYRIHPKTGEYKLHAGIDITPIGANNPIQSMGAGTVTFAGYHVTGGNMVVINHGNGVQSYYMHLSSMSVIAGDNIDTSQNIGIMGNTGGSTGTHLHFEIRVNGQPVDPLYIFK